MYAHDRDQMLCRKSIKFNNERVTRVSPESHEFT